MLALSLVGLGLTLSCASIFCGHGTTQRLSPDARGMCLDFCSLHIHEPNKPVLYKLSILSYPVAGVENGLRQNLSHGSVFIFLDLTLHLHVYLLLTATHSPCLSTRLLAMLAACKLCPSLPALVLLLPLPGTCSVQTMTPRIASVRASYKVTLQFGSVSQSSLALTLL